MKRDPKFNIGDRVYHIIPESEQGIVKNIQYLFAERLFVYEVVFCESKEPLWHFEHELSPNKLF
jgi:hypothetical protein